ncbi:hypothetical protein ACPF37_003512 [Vibrio cholerae]
MFEIIKEIKDFILVLDSISVGTLLFILISGVIFIGILESLQKLVSLL